MSIDFIVPYEISLIFLRELLSSSRSFPDSAKPRTINSQKEQARESSLLRAHFTFPVFDIPRSPAALRTPDTYATVCAFTLSSTSWSTRMQKALSIDRHPATKVPWHRFSSRLPDPRGPRILSNRICAFEFHSTGLFYRGRSARFTDVLKRKFFFSRNFIPSLQFFLYLISRW